MAAQLRVNQTVEGRESKLRIDPPVPAGTYAYELVVVDVLDIESLPETIQVTVR